MRILLANDDGIQAEGLLILAEQLMELGELYIAAPLHERSGASHSLTTNMPIRAHHRSIKGITDKAWAIDGTPTDCVKLAIEVLMADPPDIVISGINNGPNLGTDIHYSGTVAAAMEGYLNNCPAIALSAAGVRRGKGVGNYHYAAQLAVKLCRQLAENDFQPKMMLNINVPGSSPEDIKGIAYTHMGWRWYKEPFAHRVDPSGRNYYWLQGHFDDENCGKNSDVEACNNGYVTITPIRSDFTDYDLLDKLCSKGFNFDSEL